jgi:hypothetical protein
MAKARRRHFNLNFAAAGGAKVELHDFERLRLGVGRLEASLAKNGGLDAHRGPGSQKWDFPMLRDKRGQGNGENGAPPARISPFVDLTRGDRPHPCPPMDALTLFGLVSVTAMLVFYTLEDRSPWYVLAFAGACALGSLYGFLQGAWPFGVVEAVWSAIAVRRWRMRITNP